LLSERHRSLVGRLKEQLVTK